MREPVNARQVLSADQMRDLAEGILGVLTAARRRGKSSLRSYADWVAVWIAPLLAEHAHELVDARRQVEQAGAALAEVVANAAWLGDLAYRRHLAAARLRQELSDAAIDADRFRGLTTQTCPAGLHTGWYAPSAGRKYACPWCLITELAGEDDEAARIAALAEIAELETDAEQAQIAYEADEDAAESYAAESYAGMSAYDFDPDDEDDHPTADGGHLDDLDDVGEFDEVRS